MGTVIMHSVVSVDGFIADANDDVGPLHEWYFSGDVPIAARREPGYDHSGAESAFKVSSASAPYVQSMWESIDAIVMGRHLFDLVNGWEGVVPVIFGSGKRYFGRIEDQHLLDDPHVVIQGERVLHLRFRVRR